MKNIFLFSLIILLFSCAEVLPPSGGEKDNLPPEIISLYPQNGALLFVENEIEIKFNEFFKINTSTKDIFISPSLTKKPTYKVLGKKLIVSFNEKLLENTTYKIDFGESIQDYNEGNKLTNFDYTFSTGLFLDSLKLSGQVLNSFDKSVKEGVSVLLYSTEEDSVLYKKPLYFTKTDANGNYEITNIKAGNYKIAALNDKNLNRIFDQNSEEIAFKDDEITISENKLNENLYLFINTEEVKILETNNKTDNLVVFNFNRPFSEISLDISTYNKKDVFYYSKDKQALYYWYLNTNEETKFLFNSDLKDTINLNLKSDQNKEAFAIKIEEELMKDKNIFILTFPFPINTFDKSLLNIKNSSKETIDYQSTFKENNMKLFIEANSTNDSLFLKIDSLCFSSFHDRINKSSNQWFYNFSAISSNLILTLPILEENIILQLINKDKEIIEEKNVSRETKVEFNNIKAGKYYVRIYQDYNNNGIWDSGLFHVKQQAEKTLFYSKEIELKPNWDKELEVKF